MTHHATGSFDVQVKPLAGVPAEGLKRMSIDKQLHGGLEASSKGEMISSGSPQSGAAGYVAMEVVTGTLDGKSGSFAMQHFATLEAGGQHLQISIVPGSGTGALEGISGSFTITIAGSKHSYDLEYSLPPSQ